MEAFRIVFHPTNSEFLYTGETGAIRSIPNDKNESSFHLKTSSYMNTALALSPNSKFLAVGNSNGDIFIFDLENKNKMTKLDKCH